MAITTSEAARALTEAGRRSPALRCRGLRKQFGDKAVVADVSFTVPAGDILALVGPSGCGKTTLLRLIAGFERLDGGAVEIDGQTMADDTRHVPPEGRRVGMVFQDYAVFPHLSVGRNVGFALGKGEPARARVAELLAFVGLQGRENAMPHELSGGEQQRVAIARAFASQPKTLFADEPTGNLDSNTGEKIIDLLFDLNREQGTTLILITHEERLASRCQRRIILSAGAIVSDSNTELGA